MEIKINGRPADITIDNEKTVAEVMAGIEQWLAGSGHRLSGITVDGQAADISSMENVFAKEIDTIKTLDLSTTPITELGIMSLANLYGDIEEYDGLSFSERKRFFEDWKTRPQAVFALEQMPDLFSFFENTFLNGAFSTQTLRSITEERLREIETPVDEFSNSRPLIEETCARLADLPLDIQTGKDSRAAQTIQIFSSVTEKFFRVYRQLEIQGYIVQNAAKENLSGQINEFSGTVMEFLQAYEKNDTVLVGDLAEYEIAPRLQKIYNTAAGEK
ncbi:MAG: hypothetical protein LBI04_02530 [Treponema sp.]|jgi:hypothetical protein|nr:hypothetical protein [Treponema sp.]